MDKILIERSAVLQLITDELKMLKMPIVDVDPVIVLIHLIDKIFELAWYKEDK